MLDIEKLIEAIQIRPALYDTKSRDYNNKAMKATHWNEIGEEMYADWNEMSPAQRKSKELLLMKKWKSLRDNFVRDYRIMLANEPLKKKKYLFYDNLTFLAPYVKHGDKILALANNSTSVSDPEEDHDHGDEQMLSTLWDDLSDPAGAVVVVQEDSPSEPPKKRGRGKRTPGEVTNLPEIASVTTLAPEVQEPEGQEEGRADRYGNRAFLMSYLPVMDALPPRAQLQARMMITTAFFELQSQFEAFK